MSAIPVGLSTSSVFPEETEHAFALAAEIGYDGVELMVTADRLTQDAARLEELAQRHGTRVLSVHSPCLAVSAGVWGTDPVGKIERSIEVARALGARTVIAHPPLRWQRAAAAHFPEKVAEVSQRALAESGVRVAIENMYPLRVAGVVVNLYRPHWDVTVTGYPAYVLDTSHAAVAGVDADAMAQTMGERLVHVHVGDGSGAARDEHLVPGRGIARITEVLRGLREGRWGRRAPDGSFDGAVVLEVSTRTRQDAERRADLAEALAYVRGRLA